MSNNQMVSVPLELLKRVAIGYPQAEALALGRSAAIVELGAFLCRAAEQRQGEPVALPDRDAMHIAFTACKYHAPHIFEAGWNACLEEIAKLGPLYTHPAPVQGEPVEPWFYLAECDDPDYSGLFNHESEAQTQVNDHGGHVVKLWNVPPCSDPAEVERLREELSQLRDEDLKWQGLRQQEREIDTLRAQLAEVLETARGLTIQIHSFFGNTEHHPDCKRDLEELSHAVAALSASAEPSAPDCEGCNDTGYHSSQEPPFLDVVPCTTRGCRTALERKP